MLASNLEKTMVDITKIIETLLDVMLPEGVCATCNLHCFSLENYDFGEPGLSTINVYKVADFLSKEMEEKALDYISRINNDVGDAAAEVVFHKDWYEEDESQLEAEAQQ